MSCFRNNQVGVVADHFAGYSEMAALLVVVPRDTLVPFLLKPLNIDSAILNLMLDCKLFKTGVM